MSLSTQTNRTDHTENGVTTVFPFDFKIFSEADLVVISVDQNTLTETTLSLGTDYTISGVNAESGSITKTAGTSGDGLVIKRVVDLTQPTVLRNQSDFFPATHEKAFDRIVMQNQQQQEELDRAVKFSPTSTSSGTMPKPVPGYAVGFDINGDLAAVPNTGADQTLAWTAADNLIRSDLTAETAARTAADNLIRSDLAAPTGAGLSGFSRTVDYTTGTLGAKVQSIPDDVGGPLWGLKMALDSSQTTAIQILSDSTANDTTDWPYLLAQDIAADHPDMTVDFRLWDDATQDYSAAARVQTGTDGERYLDCGSGTYARKLDNNAVPHLTGTIDIRAKLTCATWTPAFVFGSGWIIGEGTASAGGRSWRLDVQNAGYLRLWYTTDGSTLGVMTSTVVTGLSAGSTKWVRCVFTPNDGGGNRVAKFYLSDNGKTWVQLGTTVTTAGAVTLYDAIANGYAYNIGGEGSTPSTGFKIYEVEVRDGENGPNVVPAMPDLWAPYGTGTNPVMVGAPVINFICGAHPGAAITYLADATRLPKMTPQYGQTITFLSDSHNDARIISNQWYSLYADWVGKVRLRLGSAGIVAMTQNPETTGALYYEQHARRRTELVSMGKALGLTVLDTFQVFMDVGWPGALMADTVHPNLAGSTVWANYVKKRIDQALG